MAAGEHPLKTLLRFEFSWIAAGLIVGAAYLELALNTRAGVGAGLTDLFRCIGWVALAMGVIGLRARWTGRTPPIAGILLFSLIFHGIGVFAEPVLEDDGNRYLLDGWVFAETGSPYGVPPSQFFEEDALPDGFEAILSGINHPDLSTIYGPTLQWLFRAAYHLAPGEMRPLQALMALVSFLLVCGLARRVAPLPCLFLAWHPLLIKEFAMTGHTDIIAVALLVAAFVMPRRFLAAAGVLAGLSVGAKIFALCAIPALLRGRVQGWIAFGLTLVLLYAPFVDSIFAVVPASAPLAAMGGGWIFNAPLYVALQSVTGPWLLRAGLAVGFIAYSMKWMKSDLWTRSAGSSELPRADRLFGMMLICSPVVNAWYLIWPLAFWASRPTWGIGVASFAVFLSYGNGLHLGTPELVPYEMPAALLALEAGLILLALGIDSRTRRG